MKKLWNKIVFQIKRVPWYGWVAGVAMLLIDIAFYAIAKPIINAWSYQWAIIPKINAIDGGIPFVGYFFIEVYFFSYLFWIFGPIVASVSRKDKFLNYMFGLLAAYVIGFCIFIFAPTYMDRVAEGTTLVDGTIGPKIQAMNNGLSKFCFKVMLFFDGGKQNLNLYPSFHCLISLFCYLGIARNKDITLGSRIYALAMTMLISLSTLFVKQHYFIDVIGGWCVAVVGFGIMYYIDPGKKLVKKYPNLFVIKKKPNRNLQKKK